MLAAVSMVHHVRGVSLPLWFPVGPSLLPQHELSEPFNSSTTQLRSPAFMPDILCPGILWCSFAMGGPHYPVATRVEAVKCLNQACGDIHKAIQLLKLAVPDESLRPSAHDLPGFMHYWDTMFTERGTVHDQRPPGQPSCIDDDTANNCVSQLLAGYKMGRRQCYYRSIADAVKRCAYIREVKEHHGITECTLLRRLKKACPGLTRRVLRYVRKLKSPVKAARVRYCQALLALPKQERQRLLNRVIWIDSKKMYVGPKDMHVYAPPHAQLLVEDERMPASSYDLKKINYYAAVNAVIGPVYFQYCTGTTKYKELLGFRSYKVSVAAAAACSLA